MIIGVDLDNTMFTCNSFIYKVINKFQYANLHSAHYKEVKTQDTMLSSSMLKNTHKVFNPIKYKSFPQAVETINLLYSLGCKIYFVSRRPNFSPLVKATVEWLQINKVNYDKLILSCKNKVKYADEHNIKLFIDDCRDVCLRLEQRGIRAVLFRGSLKEGSEQLRILKPANILIATSWKSISNNVDSLLQESSNKHKILPVNFDKCDNLKEELIFNR